MANVVQMFLSEAMHVLPDAPADWSLMQLIIDIGDTLKYQNVSEPGIDALANVLERVQAFILFFLFIF
jgi:hypothetical protein